MGLFATRRLRKGTLIPYGNVVPLDEQLHLDCEETSKWVYRNKMLCGACKYADCRSVCDFINCDRRRQNCRIRIIGMRAFMYVFRVIAIGEELYACYGDHHGHANCK